MTYVSLTRLRLRSLRFLPAFLLHAQRTTLQARRARGYLDGRLLADRDLAFWTMTAWTDQAAMRRYVLSGAHEAAMPRLARWCDEAAIAHWEQADAALPDWPTADRRLRAEGRPSKLRHRSAHHDDLSHRPPRTSRSAPLRPA